MEVNRLIVIAGVSGVGKSYLIDKLKAEYFSELVEKFKMGDPKVWNYVLAKHFKRLRQPKIDRLVLHYDLTRSWRRCLKRGYRDDTPLQVFKTAKKIDIMTLWVAPEILISRIIKRRQLREPKKNHCEKKFWWPLQFIPRLKFGKREKRDVLELYQNPRKLVLLYSEWADFCKQFNSINSHWFYDFTPGITSQIKPFYREELEEKNEAYSHCGI